VASGSDILRSMEMATRSPTYATTSLQCVADTVAECLVEEPVNDRVDSAVRVSEPQSEWEDARLTGVKTEVNAQ